MNIDSASTRLRQAIVLNDLALVKRILKANPSLLYNAVYSDKAETSLHLAASLGLDAIARYLILVGHDSTTRDKNDLYNDVNGNHGISVNTDGQTPLHLAAANLHTSIVEMLCVTFPATIDRKDNEGRTPLLLASGAQAKSISAVPTAITARSTQRVTEDISTISTLLSHGADVRAQDMNGNTCLHNACAFGNLKAVRALIHAGADPSCMNYAGWKPEYYSLSVQAEVYYKTLVNEFEKRQAEEHRALLDRRGKGGGAVRLVAQEDDDESDSTDSLTGRVRADSGRSHRTFESAMS